MATTFKGQIEYFLQEVLSKPASALPKGAQWILVFENLGGVKAAIIETAKLEPKKWEIEKGFDTITTDSLQKTKGCMFVQAVGLPEESIIANPEGLQYNQFIRTSVGGGRNTNNTLRISFLETNVSFVDNVIRPWVVTTGRLGMIARPDEDGQRYRDNISLYKLGVTQRNVTPTILMKYTFYGVCPIEVSSEEYNYIPSSSPTIRETIFHFHYYDAKIPTSSNTSILYTNTEPAFSTTLTPKNSPTATAAPATTTTTPTSG